jgi:hypothetical protein
MTDEELAQITKWQTTDEGRAEMQIHALDLVMGDLENSACTREGFVTIRKSRSHLIAAREVLDRLIASTSMFHAEAAE